MRLWLPAIALVFIGPRRVYGDDGPINWAKAPGYDSGIVRECANWVFVERGSSLQLDLGCSVISCLCRPDLVKKAQDYIKDYVLKMCGAAAQVDVDITVKIYNDYCSSNGFAIPGYTYISTSTVRSPTGTNIGATTGATATAITSTGATAAATVRGTTALEPATVTVASATVTVLSKSGCSRVEPWTLFHLLLLFSAIPFGLILALPDSLVVTYTPPAREPGRTLIETTVISPPLAATTKVVLYTPTSSAPSQATVTAKAGSPPSGSDNGIGGSDGSAGGSGKRSVEGLTTLEKTGIIIGILVGLITTLATVWKCLKKARPGNSNSGMVGADGHGH